MANNHGNGGGEVILYQPDATIRLEVLIDEETVWLTQAQITELFQRDRTVITRHINNVFNERELPEGSNVHFLHIPNSDKPVKLYRTSLPPVEGIFYDGQIFDAHAFVCDLIRNAKRRIVLIDNYIDDTVLHRLDKRAKGVPATIYTQQLTKILETDLKTHNAQYPPIEVKLTQNVHDRFMIVDDDVYHIGASIKDLGKKIFAFSQMNEQADELLGRIV